MSRHDPIVRLRHMLDHAREARDLARGRCRADLDSDRLLNLSLVHLLEIVGEAAAWTPQEVRQLYPSIPWRDIVDLRNRLIHGYDTVNFDILWQIIQTDLPPLVAELERILKAKAGGPR
ncbi:MAG: DUF86 domain-containing protein [Planctomycetes bacterium]|nr:DUF86 domain-containing protein [Planctomycetota bacterium]